MVFFEVMFRGFWLKVKLLVIGGDVGDLRNLFIGFYSIV